MHKPLMNLLALAALLVAAPAIAQTTISAGQSGTVINAGGTTISTGAAGTTISTPTAKGGKRQAPVRAMASRPNANAADVPAGAGGERVVIRSHNGHQTIACEGNEVVVEGNNNELTLTGTCTRLTILGNNNEVQTAAVQVVDARGSNNQVQWSGPAPKVSNVGSNNELGAK